MNLKRYIKITNPGDQVVSFDKDGFGLQSYAGKRYVSLVKDASNEFVGEYLDDSKLYDGIKQGLHEQNLDNLIVQLRNYDNLPTEPIEVEPPPSTPNVPPGNPGPPTY